MEGIVDWIEKHPIVMAIFIFVGLFVLYNMLKGNSSSTPSTSSSGSSGSSSGTSAFESGFWAGASSITGATGPAGPAGATGATGPAGPAGATGATGPKGATGSTGSSGSPGKSTVIPSGIALGPSGVPHYTVASSGPNTINAIAQFFGLQGSIVGAIPENIHAYPTQTYNGNAVLPAGSVVTLPGSIM